MDRNAAESVSRSSFSLTLVERELTVLVAFSDCWSRSRRHGFDRLIKVAESVHAGVVPILGALALNLEQHDVRILRTGGKPHLESGLPHLANLGAMLHHLGVARQDDAIRPTLLD